MNFRLTAALFAAIFVLGLGLLVVSLLDDKASPTDALVEELTAAAVKPDEVDTVEIERPGQAGKLVMARSATDKDKWEIREPVKATADRFAVEGLVQSLFRAKPTTYAELSTNLNVHGLEPPSIRVTLRKGDKASTINVGEVTPGGTKSVAFVTTSARPKRPIAVPRSAIDALLRDATASGPAGNMSKWTADFRAKPIFTADSRKVATDVTAVKLTNKDKTLELKRAGTDWTFVSPANWGAADDIGDTNPAATGFTGVGPLLTALTSLQALGVDDFIESPGDLKQYGLEPGNPDIVRVELTVRGSPEVVYVGKAAPGQPPAQGAPPTPSNKWFVHVEGEAGVIRANGSKLESLAAIVADPNPIRDRTLLTFDKSRIDAIDLTFPGQTIKLRKAGGVPQWKLYGAANDPTLVNAKLVDDMLNVLGERRTIRDFPASNDANFAGAEQKLEIKLWAEGIDAAASTDPKAEPKLKGTPFALQIGKQEGDRFFVRRTLATGAKADFIMPERVPISGPVPLSVELLPTLRKDRLALLDPALPSFSPFSASKLTITTGPAVTELDRADDPTSPDGKWTYAKPDAQKGRAADATAVQVELLGTLSRLAATRFIGEAPTEADLAKWGLDPKSPRMKVVVGLKTTDADKERVYYIGNDAGDGFVYAKQDGRAAVFTVPSAVFTKLAATDLRDKTVVKFDKAKVKGLRVRGWKEAAGQMLTRDFEKQATGEWVARSKDYAADGAKINALLGILDGLKAKTFVEGAPQPQHRFPPESESGFEVTIELDGAPPLSLNIAGETPDKSAFFGFSSMLPPTESLFTVPADALRPFKASAGSLVLVK